MTKRKRRPRRKRVSILIDKRTLATLELWAESLGLDFGGVLQHHFARYADRGLRIVGREMTFTPAQRRQYQPIWDEIDRRLGMSAE